MNTHRFRLIAFAAAILVLSPSACWAQPARLLPFQARLTDASGQPVSDGPRVVQFQIFGEPTGGAALWAGETHRVTINGGLVNVMLGTKNPLPSDRPDDASRSFFDATLYLQITVDANGDGKFTDADPPLLPRQAIVPVLFAAEAGNARKLNGYDWTALLGTANPQSGYLLPARIQDGSLPGAKLIPGSITGGQIAPGAVGTAELGVMSVGGANVADGAIEARHLAIDAVPWDRLAPRTTNAIPELGRVAISNPVTSQKLTGTAFEDIENLTVTIRTRGRPILAFLAPWPLDNYSKTATPDTSPRGEPSGVYFVVNPSTSIGVVRLLRDAGKGAILSRFGSGAGGSGSVGYPSLTGLMIDLPPPGLHTYKLQWGFKTGDGGRYAEIYNSVLVVFEL